MNKQDSSRGNVSLLTGRHTQGLHWSQAQQTMQFCRVLTDTSQQQLYPEQNTEDNNKNDAKWFSWVSLTALNTNIWILYSNPVIDIPNLPIIKIPRLLVNSLTVFCCPTKPHHVISDDFDASSTHQNVCEEKVGSIWYKHRKVWSEQRTRGSLESNWTLSTWWISRTKMYL